MKCQRCNKNKATIKYTEGTMAYAHGFVEEICQECLDKMQRATPLYKKTYNTCLKDFKEKIQEELDNHRTIIGKDKMICFDLLEKITKEMKIK